MSKLDLQNRAPSITRTFDFRNIVQRRYDVLNFIPKDPVKLLADCWLPLGTKDDVYEDCYLTVQKVEGQNGDSRKPCEDPPVLFRQFEELNGLNETQTDEPAVTVNQYGYKEVTINWAQLSLGTATYQVPGTTAGPSPFTDCILRDQVAEDNGTLRTIKRTYVAGGELSDVTDIKFGGKLLVRTLRYLNPLVTPTLAGYTLTATNIEYINGLPIKGYVFTAGGGGGGTGTGGQIDETTVYHDSSNQGTTGVTIISSKYLTDLSVTGNPITAPAGFIAGTSIFLIATSRETEAGYALWGATWARGLGEIGRDITYGQTADGGTTGTTTTTITHLTFSSVGTNPTTAPAGSTLVSIDHREADGYRVWTVRYGAGTGTVVTDVDIKNGGKLYLYHRVGLNAPPTTPSPTIAGTVTLVSPDVRFADGYTIYDYQWAEGVGEISREFVTHYGGGQTDFDIENPGPEFWNQALIICTIKTLTALSVNADPSIATRPVGTPGFTLIQDGHEDDDGYRLWTSVYASGSGVISDSTETKNGGNLIIYRKTALNVGVIPTPDPTIGGTVVLIDAKLRYEDDARFYDFTWAEGNGTIDLTTRPREDGSIEHVIITLSAAAELPAAPGFPGSFNYSRILAGTAVYCVNLKNDAQDGYYLNTATWIEPPTNRSTEKRTVTFTVPGLATAANPPTFSPPISRRLLAQVFEYWGTTPNPNSDTPYTITSWAQLEENYEIADTGQQVSNITALDGYVGSSTITGSNTTYRGIDVTTFATAVGGSSPTTKPTGLTVLDLEWEPYLTDINGVIVWKTTALKFTF